MIGKVWATAWNTLNTCDSLRRSWEDQDQIQDARETIITLRVHKRGVYSTEISIQQMFIISKGNTNVKKTLPHQYYAHYTIHEEKKNIINTLLTL